MKKLQNVEQIRQCDIVINMIKYSYFIYLANWVLPDFPLGGYINVLMVRDRFYGADLGMVTNVLLEVIQTIHLPFKLLS